MTAMLQPERYYSRISQIDIQEDILDRGFTHVLLDIDNTILTRDTHEIPDDVLEWLLRAQAAGVTFCLLSNNFHHGVFAVAEALELPIVAKAVKPLPQAFIRAMKLLGVPKRNILMIGDQLITDVWGAHVCGLPAYLLQPLVATDLWHTLLLRHVERAILTAPLIR